MSTLHTVNKSPFERNALQSCVGHLTAGDAVLMIEDGVVGARKGSSAAAPVKAALASGSVYALAPDLAARGIKPEHLIDGVKPSITAALSISSRSTRAPSPGSNTRE